MFEALGNSKLILAIWKWIRIRGFIAEKDYLKFGKH